MRSAWDFATADPRGVPGARSMVGYRALDVPDGIHAGLPSASLTFIVSLDDGVRASFDPAALATSPARRVLLGGLHTRPSHVEQSTGQAGIQLAIHPLAARALFGLPAAAVADLDLDGQLVWGRRSVELADRLSESGPDWSAAFAQVAVALRQQVGRTRSTEVRPELRHAWTLLERSAGRIGIATTAREIGLSARRLRTLFHEEVGVGPKTVARLMRFEAASEILKGRCRVGNPVDLAAVAADTGYADQAHLTREFTEFAGAAPARWMRHEFRILQDDTSTTTP